MRNQEADGEEEDFLNPNEYSKMKFIEMDCSQMMMNNNNTVNNSMIGMSNKSNNSMLQDSGKIPTSSSNSLYGTVRSLNRDNQFEN